MAPYNPAFASVELRRTGPVGETSSHYGAGSAQDDIEGPFDSAQGDALRRVICS